MEGTHFSSTRDHHQESTHMRKTLSGRRINLSFSRPHHENNNEVQDFVVHGSLVPQRHHVGPSHDQNMKESKDNGRERLKRHREEVAGNVMIPDNWGQESRLKDWIDYSSFDKLLAPSGLASARDALVAEGHRRASSQRLRIESRCC